MDTGVLAKSPAHRPSKVIGNIGIVERPFGQILTHTLHAADDSCPPLLCFVAAMPDATLRVRRSRGPDGTRGFRVQRTLMEGADAATSDSEDEEEFFDCAPALPPADAATRTAIRALRARLVPAVLSGTTTPEQLNSARRQLSAGIVAAAAAAEEAQLEAQREAAVAAAAATATAAEMEAASELELEPEPEPTAESQGEAEPELELKGGMDPVKVLAMMAKAMAAPVSSSSSSPVMDAPGTPMEAPRRSRRARLFVLLEGGTQPDDAKVFDRGKHTHTHSLAS
eukprot:COSAG01_NODE_2204_length_8173_cov_4.803939_6_plen_283_part_00